MKIYNEVTIDMNPESDTYGKHLSEDSCNYTGDIALCGGGGNGGRQDRGTRGAANTGAGGGGGGYTPNWYSGAEGGSGIVLIAYPT